MKKQREKNSVYRRRKRKEEEHKKNKYFYTECFKIHGHNFRDGLFQYAKIKFKKFIKLHTQPNTTLFLKIILHTLLHNFHRKCCRSDDHF